MRTARVAMVAMPPAYTVSVLAGVCANFAHSSKPANGAVGLRMRMFIAAVTTTPSSNVRLSALDALYPHANQPIVRSGVIATLPREQNPLVQVAMIDFLVAARDRAAVPELEKIVRNDTINQVVRDAAKRGLAQL